MKEPAASVSGEASLPDIQTAASFPVCASAERSPPSLPLLVGTPAPVEEGLTLGPHVTLIISLWPHLQTQSL